MASQGQHDHLIVFGCHKFNVNVASILADSQTQSIRILPSIARFEGLTGWFVGEGGHQPTVDRLADAAVGAVVDLIRTLARLNEQRLRPADRAADMRRLAGWIMECKSDSHVFAFVGRLDFDRKEHRATFVRTLPPAAQCSVSLVRGMEQDEISTKSPSH